MEDAEPAAFQSPPKRLKLDTSGVGKVLRPKHSKRHRTLGMAPSCAALTTPCVMRSMLLLYICNTAAKLLPVVFLHLHVAADARSWRLRWATLSTSASLAPAGVRARLEDARHSGGLAEESGPGDLLGRQDGGQGGGEAVPGAENRREGRSQGQAVGTTPLMCFFNQGSRSIICCTPCEGSHIKRNIA